MPLAAVASGQQAQSSQLNQLINLLTGVMTDQPVTLGNALTVTGAGSTAAPTAGAAAASQLALIDTGNAVGSGGALLIGGQAAKFFAAVKGALQDGSTNTRGDLVFYTRNAVGDTSLTESMRLSSAGLLSIGGAAPTTNVIPKKLYAPTKAAVYEQTVMLGTLGWMSGDSNAPGAGYLGYNIGYDVAAGAWKFLTSGTGWLVGATGAGSGTVDYVAYSAAYGAAGTGATINERFRAYGGGGFLLQGAGSGLGSGGAALQFAAANPYILSNGSYIVIPNGLYISGGTPYFQNQVQARGGVNNDQGRLTLTSIPGARAHANASQSIAGITFTKVTLGVVDSDPYSNFASSRYTCPVAGRYLVAAVVSFSSITGAAYAFIYKNGTEYSRSVVVTNAGVNNIPITDVVVCAAGDYIELWCYAGSGATAGGTYPGDASTFAVNYVGS